MYVGVVDFVVFVTRLNVRVQYSEHCQSVKGRLWAELSVWREVAEGVADATIIQNDRLMLAGDIGRTQYAVARTARKEDPTTMHGLHARTYYM